eukprot:EG_transcript_4062
MIDDIEDKIDKVENAFDLCQMLMSLQTVAVADARFTNEQKASFFMSFIRKATTYYCPQLCEPLLKFIDKYLTHHNIRQIDFVLSKYLEQVQSHPLPEKVKGCFRRVIDGRRKDSLRSTAATVCPTCGHCPDGGERNGQMAPSGGPAAEANTGTNENQGAQPAKEALKSDKALLQEEVKGIMQMVDGRSGPSLADEKKRVKGLFEPQKGRHEDEEEIEAVGLQVSLQCPLSYMRIMTPVKGFDCRHIQCFDLESFLITNLGKRKKKKDKEVRDKRQGDEWRCPVCNKVLQKQDLYVDKYFLDILNKAEAAWRNVEIKPDATWCAITEGSKAKSEFKDVIVIDDEAPELPFDWSTLPTVKVEEVDVEGAAESEVDWGKLFSENHEKWLKKRFPACQQKLIGVTRDELLLTPKPILSLLFPDLGLGAKLYDELTPHRPSEMADSLTKAQPYYVKFTKKMAGDKSAAGPEAEAPSGTGVAAAVTASPDGTASSSLATADAPGGAPSSSPVPGNDAADDDEEEAEDAPGAGVKKRTRGGRKRRKGDPDAAGQPPPKPKPPPLPPSAAPAPAPAPVPDPAAAGFFPTPAIPMPIPGMPFMPYYNPMMASMMPPMMPMMPAATVRAARGPGNPRVVMGGGGCGVWPLSSSISCHREDSRL